MTPLTRRELLELLEALCDERLTSEQHARLDRLVVADPEARRLYVDYIALHGMLIWDTAAAAGEPVPARTDDAATRRRRYALAGTIAASALALLIAFLLRPPQRQVAPAGTDVAGKAPDSPEAHLARSGAIPEILLGDHRPPGDDRSAGTSGDVERRLAAVNPQDFSPIDVPLAVSPVAAIREAIHAGWRRSEIEPSPIADDAEWVRRLYLDLAGRIPSPDEAESFFADANPDRRTRRIDALLESPETARNFATSWTNLLVGRADDPDLDRTALHHYLQEQFSGNRPWSETVTALVTAEGGAHESGPANFLLAHLNNEAVPATAVTARCFRSIRHGDRSSSGN